MRIHADTGNAESKQERSQPPAAGKIFSAVTTPRNENEKDGAKENTGSERGSQAIIFDTGNSVVIGRKIAEGGFSSVFIAHDVAGEHADRRPAYALKRINCNSDLSSRSTVSQCQKEAGIYRMFHHENLMPLLGIKFEPSSTSIPTTCYMLFPYLPLSLQADLTARRLLEDTLESQRRPYAQREALDLFAGIVRGIRAMHGAGWSHRDVKVDNILLNKDNKRVIPVLTDFGSAGPLILPLRSDSDVLSLLREAAQHTTIPYVAPELWREGYETLQSHPSQYMDYGRADVWSLGCTFFALLYGASPFEIKWRASLVGNPADGTVQFVECTAEKVWDPVPFPPEGAAADGRYGEDIKTLISWMLSLEMTERLSITEVAEKIEDLLRDGAPVE